MLRLSIVASLSLWVACAEPLEPADTTSTADPHPTERGGPDGSNCAPALPVMVDATGALRPFQSVVAHLYRIMQFRRAEVGDRTLLDLALPPPYDRSAAHVESLAKAVSIFADRDEIGFAHHRYYQGQFGFGPPLGEPVGEACTPFDDEGLRAIGLAAHTALAQASECGRNSDGLPRFYEVGPLFLLRAGQVYDARALVAMGLATWTTEAPPERCIVPARRAAGPDVIAVEVDATRRPIPCDIAFRDDAVTEAVVELVPSSAVVDVTPVLVRPFTAAGFAPLPNGLDGVRRVLRDGWLRAMAAVDVPVFALVDPADLTRYDVVLVGHPVGPLRQPSSLLLPEERAWVDAQVGRYDEVCCHEVCTTARAAGATARATETTPPPPPPEPTCHRECIPEGQCQSGLSHGLTVMLSGASAAECAGDCPHPAVDAPAEPPTCEAPTGGAPPPEQP